MSTLAGHICLEMAVYTVFTQPEYRIYRASICSKATFFVVVMNILIFLIPLLIVYRSNGLWIETMTTFEQPDVAYKHKIISFVSVNTTYLAWSTYPQFNSIYQNNLRIPLVRSREADENKDGKNDILFLDLDFPMNNSESVTRVDVLLFFDYKLRKKCAVTAEAMAHISGESSSPGQAFTILGEIKLKQRNPLPHKGVYNQYNTSVVNEGSYIPSDYDLHTLFKEYYSRNLTVQFVPVYQFWRRGTFVDGWYRIHIEIKYPEEEIVFYTGFWQLIKYAVVQYIAILIIFAFLIERLKQFVFSHQLVNTVAVKSIKLH